MQIRLKDLRETIREIVLSEVWRGKDPDVRLVDDDKMKEKSILVPDDIKDAIRVFFKSMHL